ncbi:hypothetical protein [Desulfothermobacter acidiphilus]|uniref:hypothetical protein n=1 Tax=Desulfothermobacter acidiphilus TaxID=1938353 RepID=UPI003F8932BC
MLGFHFLRQALKKRLGNNLVLLYQELSRPGPWPEAQALARRIAEERLPLPVVAVGEKIIAAGKLPRPEELARLLVEAGTEGDAGGV